MVGKGGIPARGSAALRVAAVAIVGCAVAGLTLNVASADESGCRSAASHRSAKADDHQVTRSLAGEGVNERRD